MWTSNIWTNMTVLSVTKTTHLLCTVQICITSKIFVKMNSFGGWVWLNCRLGTSSRQAVWLGVLYLWFPVFTASLSDWMCSLRPPSLLNAVPTLTLKGKNVTSAGWQVTPCDPMWVPVAVWQPCELLYTCYLCGSVNSSRSGRSARAWLTLGHGAWAVQRSARQYTTPSSHRQCVQTSSLQMSPCCSRQIGETN